MKIDPYYQRQKCKPMTVVSGDIPFMRHSHRFPGEGASNDSGVVDNGNFQRFRWLFLRKFRGVTSVIIIYMAILRPSSAFQ